MRVSVGRGVGLVPPWAAGSLASPLPEFLSQVQKEQGKWMHGGTGMQETTPRGAEVSTLESLGGTPGPRLGPLQPCCVCVCPHRPGPLIRSSFN